MDEVAREAILEAMQQNDIRPFESCRSDIVIGEVSIPPRKVNKKKKKRKKGADVAGMEPGEEKEPEWLVFDEMKDALKAGWEVSYLYCLVLLRLLSHWNHISIQLYANFSFENCLFQTQNITQLMCKARREL